MNFRNFIDGTDMMEKTGLTPEECLRLVDIELERIRKRIRKEDY